MTDWLSLVRPGLRDLRAYHPGESADELRRRTGVAEVSRLNRNEDLFEPFPGALEAAAAELANVWRYPEETYSALQAALAERVGTTADRIVPAHGIQGLIVTLSSLFLDPGDAIVVPSPSYGLYGTVATGRGVAVHRVPLRQMRLDLDAVAAAAAETGARIAWICDPNNPTGALIGADEWGRFLESLSPGCVAIVDEAYGDYVDPVARLPRERDVEDGRPVVLLRTFSKLYGLAGLRLGYAVADPALARLIGVVQEPFNVNRPALAAGLACLRAPDEIESRRRTAVAARELLCERLREVGAEPLPSQSNFVLVHVGGDDAELVHDLTEREGLVVRPGSDYGLTGYVRITVGPAPLMERVAAAIGERIGSVVSPS